MNVIYLIASIILALGIFLMLTSDNYFKKIVGLGILQSSVLIFYIALGKVCAGIPPLLGRVSDIYSSPLPAVLMLTAIVVGFATLSVGLALIFRIYKQFGSINETEISLENSNDLDS